MDPIENDEHKKGGEYRKWPVWVATWAYKNPSGEVSIGHSIVWDIFSHIAKVNQLREEGNVDFKPYPYYKFENVKESQEELKRGNSFIPYFLWEKYPDLKPDETLIDEWVKTGEMPDELQKDIFMWFPFPNYW